MKTLSAGAMVANSDAIINEVVLSADTSKKKGRQLKELVFLQELRDLKKNEEELEFQTQRVRKGNNLLNDKDINRINLARSKTDAAKSRMKIMPLKEHVTVPKHLDHCVMAKSLDVRNVYHIY